MFVQQLYTNCLSEAAYYIESDGEAAVIDPLRDYREYVALAKDRNAQIKYVFETHFHADFVSGHIDLAKKTGAQIIYGPSTETDYPVYVAKDKEVFKLGKLTIEAIHTPGHTPNSTCYLLKDQKGNPYCIFTGDTLFVGDVGRPDLFGEKITKEEMAGWMYESLEKLKALPDDVILYPAHGPGSACGKNLGKETWSTIGEQKKLNYALKEQTKEEFIKNITEGLTTPPKYFALNAAINKKGYKPFDEVLKNKKSLSLSQFEGEINNGAIVLDVRHQDMFIDGYIPGSAFVGLNDRFAEWVGILFDINQAFVLITPSGKEEETVMRLSRVGYENVKGYLEGGFETWKEAGKNFDMIISIDAEEFELDYKHDGIIIVDVRKESEYNSGHVDGSVNIVLQQFINELNDANIPKDEKLYVHCAGGYRSVIASSLLKRQGYYNVKNILGGWKEISKTGVKQVQEKISA